MHTLIFYFCCFKNQKLCHKFNCNQTSGATASKVTLLLLYVQQQTLSVRECIEKDHQLSRISTEFHFAIICEMTNNINFITGKQTKNKKNGRGTKLMVTGIAVQHTISHKILVSWVFLFYAWNKHTRIKL